MTSKTNAGRGVAQVDAAAFVDTPRTALKTGAARKLSKRRPST
jgi:hypothetical protein